MENFRRLLVPLVSETQTLKIECPVPHNPPRSWISAEEIQSLNGNCRVKDVIRKGKLICMVLDCIEKVENESTVYLFLHMGMTGRISTPSNVPKLESLKDTEYPPPYTYLTFSTDSERACFSDPRKFGSVSLATSMSAFDELAPDAQTLFDVNGLVGQSLGIKALLLNQKRVVSGVGNWIADEALYQAAIHPEQAYLTLDQATILREKLHFILDTAISCLSCREEFPASWLFHCRWSKRASNSGNAIKDPQGRSVVFLKAGGRTSAVVPSIQKKRSQKPKKQATSIDAKKSPPKKRKNGVSRNQDPSEGAVGKDIESEPTKRKRGAAVVKKNVSKNTSATEVPPRRRSSRLSSGG